MSPFNCLCGKSFKLRSMLYFHIRCFHNGDLKTFLVGVPPPNYSRKCPTCSFSCRYIDGLCEHVQNFHGIPLNFSTYAFSSRIDYGAWLQEEEVNSGSRFVRRHSAKIRECHRSGYYITKVAPGERKRSHKYLVSNKINAVCPAHIKISDYENGEVKVVYQSTHYGHDNDPGHLNLSRHEKNEIAAKLMRGVPKRRILNDAQRGHPENSPCPDDQGLFKVCSRMQLINIKDVLNVESQYGIKKKGSISCHKDDATSLDIWVEKELQNEGRVLFYKPQGGKTDDKRLSQEDFFLVIQTKEQKAMLQNFGHDRICVDSTHGTNCYDFTLITILVVDEFEEGYPVAHCLATRETTQVVSVFFESVKKACGAVLCKTFMSDDASAFRNAWMRVMGPPQRALLCTWHVLRAWQSNFKLVKDDRKRREAYKQLKSCAEILDVEEFESAYNNLLKFWAIDKEMEEFTKYLNTHYTLRRKMWAAAYRRGCRLNVNMRIENFHRQLKHRYFNGQNPKRVDKCVTALLDLIEGKKMDRQLKLHRGKYTKRNTAVLKRHRSGEAMDHSEYNVKLNEKHPKCSKKCGLICPICCVCYYGYECGCYDYLILGNICKHIHFKISAQKMGEINIKSTHVTKKEAESTKKEVKPVEKIIALDLSSLDELFVQQNSMEKLETNSKPNEDKTSEPPLKRMKPMPKFYSIKQKSVKNKPKSTAVPSTQKNEVGTFMQSDCPIPFELIYW